MLLLPLVAVMILVALVIDSSGVVLLARAWIQVVNGRSALDLLLVLVLLERRDMAAVNVLIAEAVIVRGWWR